MASFLCSKKSLSGLMLLCFYLVTTINAVYVDMTLVNNHPLLDPSGTDDQYIGVYVGQRNANITGTIEFDRIIRTAEIRKIPSSSSIDDGPRFRKLHFVRSNDTRATGVFRATYQYNDEEHNISTVVLMHNTTILPEKTTLTAYTNENVTMSVVTDATVLRWRYNDEDSKPIYQDDHNITLPNVQPTQSGVYRCHGNKGNKKADLQAIMILHVIRCPPNIWGPECEHNCTECLNGGMCDVDSGQCVCPPGFNGTNCENVLGSNRFGQDGSFSCDTSGDDDHSLACRGKLFCLPDPFGCTCAAGFMGIDCTRECVPGRYGANCLQECHCGPTNNCKKDTGECTNGTTCADGWTGINCQARGSPSLDSDDDIVIPDIATTSLFAPIADTTLAPIPVTTGDTTPVSTSETPQPVPSFEISSFHYSQVNNGNPTTLVCVVKASPGPPALESMSVTNTVNGQVTIISRFDSTANETTRTSWYQVTVRLDEMPKNYTCLFRGPDEMILASQDVAVYVFEPPSFNETNILVQESTSQSITIVWSAWNGNHDYGDGPVIGYHVYYNTHGQYDVVRASQNITSDVTYTITGLTHDTQYDIRVTALREGERGEGSYSSPITEMTSCIAPSAAPVLSLDDQTQSSISLSWEMIHEETWGCRSLSKILIIVSTNGQNGGPRNFTVNAEDGTATINDLQDCTTYRIKAAFQNKDELGIYSDVLSVSTSKIRPASVENLQTSPATTHISVDWVVSSSICAPDYFILRYSLYRKLACPSPETTLVQIEVNTTSTLYRLDGLEPYSTYTISVIAVNSIGESEPTTRSVDTGAGRPAAIRNVMVNPEKTSPTRLEFTWEPLNCRNVNGEFWYYYPRIYADGDRTKRPDGSEYLEYDLTSSSFKFNNLEPCTMYELNIYAGNTDRQTGEESRANGLTSVTINSAFTFGYQSKISVSWSVPSGCEVDYYRLSYQLISRRACPDVPVIDSEVNKVNVSSPLTSVIKDISDLENYATYNISIIAVIDGIESLPRSVQENTDDGKPSAIESVSYTSTAHTLTFEWEEPSCENLHGNLNEYEIDFVYSRRTERQTLSREENSLTFTDLIGCTEYTFTIRLVTATNYRSEWYAITAPTNISEPGEPNINEIGKHREEGATGLIVHWDPPTTPPCEPTHYRIQYYIYQGDMCEDIPRQPELDLISAGSVNGSTFTFTILELRPNSEYMVFVRAQTSSGYGDSDSQRALTGHSYPSGPPTNVHSTGTKKRSITFTWDKPACGYRNGPITSYDVILFDSTGGVVDQRNVSDSTAPEATIDGLNPYSNYSIGVRAWNYELPGVYSPKVWAQTDEAKPGPPIGVNIPASHQESITVEWMSPNPPLGRIIGYYVLYWETDDSSVTPIVRNVSFPCGDGLCSDINQSFSVIIPDLRPDTNYSIQVVAETSLGVGDPSPDHPLVRLTSEKSIQVLPVVLGITLAGAVLTLMIVGVFYYRRRRTSVFSRLSASFRTRENTPIYAIPDNQNGNQDRSDEYMPLKHIQCQRSHDALPTIPSSEASYEDIDAVPEVGTYANMPSVENTHAPIVLDQLITYVTQKTNSESGFKEDFQTIPAGQLHPWNVAKRNGNTQKNRYRNIIAYDHSRVKLPLLDNDPHSDYINANFIDGYNYSRKYIAAQGPNAASVRDFWRMVWEEDCCKIVMLTNLVENDKKKCEKYWPDKKMVYGKITVALDSTEVNTHYTVRKYNLKFDDNIREVVQYHYTSWPDMGVPKYTTPLMKFIKLVNQHHTSSSGPIVVHCSTGGRTGTFITLDAMLDQAEAENAIDVYNFIMSMRNNRIKMVQVAEQYQFIYKALLETFVCGDTSIAQELYLKRYPYLLTPDPVKGCTVLQEQFQILHLFNTIPREDEQKDATNPLNVPKNRCIDKIPMDKHRPFLITEVEDGSNYINASFLPGYTKKDMFIGTQTPLPDTVVDFWRLIFDYKISTIVMLNGMASEDQSMTKYWPDASQSKVTYGPFMITFVNEKHYDGLSCRSMELQNTSTKSLVHTVYQLQLTTWPMESEVCTSAISFMELHRRATAWNDTNAEDAPILVHCTDGEGTTGTFCALSSVLERLKVEKLIDVFEECKALRAIRPGAVATLAQYKFIHNVIKLSVESRGIYENCRE